MLEHTQNSGMNGVFFVALLEAAYLQNVCKESLIMWTSQNVSTHDGCNRGPYEWLMGPTFLGAMAG